MLLALILSLSLVVTLVNHNLLVCALHTFLTQVYNINHFCVWVSNEETGNFQFFCWKMAALKFNQNCCYSQCRNTRWGHHLNELQQWTWIFFTPCRVMVAAQLKNNCLRFVEKSCKKWNLIFFLQNLSSPTLYIYLGFGPLNH